jgi:structural maintenance of chromosome 3 (chondroitin sulfate proteoglycan 6)
VTITDTLKYIEDRLSELEKEKEELSKYQKLDKERRALEYIIYDKDLQQTNSSLVELEADKTSESEKANLIHTKALQARETLRTTEREIKTVNLEIQQLSKEKANLEEDKQDLIKKRASLDLDVKDNEAKADRGRTRQVGSSLDNSQTFQKQIGKELKDLEKQIEDAKGKLESASPKFEEELSNEKKFNERCENRVQK